MTAPDPVPPAKVETVGAGEGATWVQQNGLSALSAAVDEIYFLRALIADEAAIIEAHLGYKTFPKTRRGYAEEQVERMRRVARGEMYAAARKDFNQKRALRMADADDGLTNHQWAEQRGLVTSPTPEAPSRRDVVDGWES